MSLAPRGPRLLADPRRALRHAAVGLLALSAAALSVAYVSYYLRGGPRIIDATSYWLEARALAEGHFTWPIEEPTASARGRFLHMSGPLDARRVGVIFPPGYPLVLALGFLLHRPLWVGPVLGALLVLATYALARRITGRRDVALLAAALSTLCAALRYHTADTMSHGWAALLVAASLAALYAAADAPASAPRVTPLALLGGVACGWLIATRPVSGLALLPIFALAARGLRVRPLLAAAAGALLPVVILVLHQRAVTGAYFASSQSAYYAMADGPPGCFRYGFGEGIGCLHEHGSYVASVLPAGLDARAAALTTLRRLRIHLFDVANAEPLFLLPLLAPFLVAWRPSREGPDPTARRVRALAAGVLLIVLAYVPFYFDGSYPGGGARFFADVLPLEHVLLATSVGLLAERWPRAAWLQISQTAPLVCAIAIGGFAVHAKEHDQLRDRDGGRPFFEPSALADAHVSSGLLFTSTDHAFNLAYDPAARDAHEAIVVAREAGDDRDRLVWEKLGRPPAYRYVFDGQAPSRPAVVPWSPPPPPHPYRFEAEAEWPPLAQEGGYFEPVPAQGTCAWGGHLLATHRVAERPFRGTISFPVPSAGRFRVGVHLASRGEVAARFVLQRDPEAPPLATWGFSPRRKDFACATLLEEEVQLTERGLLEVMVGGTGELWLDAIALEPAVHSTRAAPPADAAP